MTEPTRVAVIGAGTMGHGIAYVSALAGYRVALTDADPAQLDRGMKAIAATFEKGIARGKVTSAQRDAAVTNIAGVASVPEAAGGAHIVIEAIPERIALKQELFATLEPLVAATTLLATNTSSLSIHEIGAGLKHRDRVIGLHFFNPVPVMQLLEIVRGPTTSDASVEFGREFALRIGKTPIVVRDTPGFATSRLGVVLGLEAIRMLEQGVASAEDIDRAMELGYNHPLGPLRLTDLVGLDVRLAIADHLHATLGGATYAAPELLRQKVREGKLGKKSGEGFFRWENG
jgi:3-hydroxybutyryl-CoA dehydrogenase